jgi:hypothetical protein
VTYQGSIRRNSKTALRHDSRSFVTPVDNRAAAANSFPSLQPASSPLLKPRSHFAGMLEYCAFVGRRHIGPHGSSLHPSAPVAKDQPPVKKTPAGRVLRTTS